MNLLLPLLLACASGTVGEGTSVGNPGEAAGRMAPTDALSLDRADLSVDTLVWTPCDGSDPVSTAGGHVDLLGPATLLVPGGCWVGVELVPAGPLLLEGQHADGVAFQARLDVGPVSLAAVQQLDVTDVAFVLELALPDWSLDDEAELVLQIELASALYEDFDGDGWLDGAERTAGVVMAGAEREADHTRDDTHDDDAHDDDIESGGDDDDGSDGSDDDDDHESSETEEHSDDDEASHS